MKLIFFLLLLVPNFAHATNYYFSNTGSDVAAGTFAAPWATITKHNATTFLSGDSIFFKDGDTFRGALIVSANGLYYGSYGTGSAPVISGAKNVKNTVDWVNVTGNIWKTLAAVGAATNTIFPKKDVGNVIFNLGAFCGFKKPTYAGMTAQGHFYFSPNDTLYLYSTSNPGSFYSDIEIGGQASQDVFKIAGRSNITVDGLEFRYSGNNLIFINNCNNIVVKNCKFLWGGGWYFDLANTRMGNGVQIWEQNTNIEIANNIVKQNFDAGISPQGNPTGYVQSNINMHHNVVDSNYYSYEVFLRSPNFFTNITFENNTCLNAGLQWSQAQRPDSADAEHIRQAVSTGTISGLTIRNNIFSGGTVRYAQMDITSGMVCDYNLIYNVPVFGKFNSSTYTTFSSWKAASAFDANSINVNPLLNADYTLQTNSPAAAGGYNGAGLGAFVSNLRRTYFLKRRR